MSYPVFGNLSLGNVSGNIKLFVNHSGIGNLTGIGYNNNAITFGVNQSATDTPEMTINRIGDVNILGNVLTGGNVVVNSIVPSTSTTTGALIIAGGAGIQGNIFLGGNLITTRDIDCNGNIQIDSTTPSISTTTGALVVAGGAGIQGNLNIGGLTYHVYDTSFNGNAQILSRTASTSTTTGALQVAGGAGIAGNLNIGLDSFFNGNIQLTQLNNPLTIVSRNASLINTTLASGSDVGIFYGATNPAAAGLVISPRGTGGGIKMAANGNMGIGTSNPQMILDVSGGIGTKIHNLFTNSQNGVMTLGSYRVYTSGLFDVGFALYHDQVGATVLNAASGQQIDFKINNVQRMRLNQDGNFGIGTTNPSKQLSLGYNSGTQKLALYDDGTSNNFYGFGVINSAIHFGAGTNNNALGQMVFTDNGRLGIGTTNPQARLDVNGNINITASNTSYISGPLVSTNTTLSTSTTTGALVVAGGVGIQGNIFLGGNLTTSRDIDCNGNLQIDSTTPSISTTSGALVVAGGAAIAGSLYANNLRINDGSLTVTSTSGGGTAIQSNTQFGMDISTQGNNPTLTISCIKPGDSSTTLTINAYTASFNRVLSCPTLQVAGGASIVESIFVGGNLITNGDISCNGNINIRFPINTTYRALPTFTDTQIGNIRANVFTTSQNILHGNTVYPFNILYNIPPGIWIANYTAYIATSNNVGGGNITFGMSTVTPAFTGTTMNVFPMDLATSYGVNKMPIPTSAASITATSGPFILSGTAVIPFNTTGTISMVGNIHGFVAAGNAVTRSVLTATRIA